VSAWEGSPERLRGVQQLATKKKRNETGSAYQKKNTSEKNAPLHGDHRQGISRHSEAPRRLGPKLKKAFRYRAKGSQLREPRD